MIIAPNERTIHERVCGALSAVSDCGIKAVRWAMEDPDAGRGRKYARIVPGEAAHPATSKDAWERAIAPALTGCRG